MLKKKPIDWQAVRARLAEGDRLALEPDAMAVWVARAGQLATRATQAENQTDLPLALTFSCKESLFGILLTELAEICTLEQFAPLPGPDPRFKGILNWHGRILSVLDLPALLGQPCPPGGGAILILRHRASGISFWVPQLLDMIPIDPAGLLAAPGPWLLGLAPGRIQLLDVPALLVQIGGNP